MGWQELLRQERKGEDEKGQRKGQSRPENGARYLQDGKLQDGKIVADVMKESPRNEHELSSLLKRHGLNAVQIEKILSTLYRDEACRGAV